MDRLQGTQPDPELNTILSWLYKVAAAVGSHAACCVKAPMSHTLFHHLVRRPPVKNSSELQKTAHLALCSQPPLGKYPLPARNVLQSAVSVFLFE